MDQFGSTEYTWKEALAANGGSLFQGGMLKLTAPEVKESLTFLQKLEELNKNYKVSSKDFDQGKVAFYPMTWLNIEPINLILTTFLNIQTLPGPVSLCLLSQKLPRRLWLRRLLLPCLLGLLIPSWLGN